MKEGPISYALVNMTLVSLLARYSHVAVKNLGVTFNRFLKMDQQITVITTVCFYQLRVTEEVKLHLLQKELKIKFFMLLALTAWATLTLVLNSYLYL